MGVGLTVAVFLLVLDKLERQESEIAAKVFSELSADIVAQADVVEIRNTSEEAVPPDPASATAEDKTQNSFVEATGIDSLEKPSSKLSEADVVQTENKPDLRVLPDHEFVTADAGLQNSFNDATGDATPEQHSEAPTASVTQAIVAETEQKSGIPAPQDTVFATADAQQQNGFEASGMDQQSIDQVATDDANRQDSSDTNTFQFWSPFRSAWAAQGFAERLTSATQVPVEVFNTGPGKYRVAFSYQDETDRLARIERIETITGLKLE